MCWDTYFCSVFEHQPDFGQKWAPKNDKNSHFAKHKLLTKKRFVWTPPHLEPPNFTQKMVFYILSFSKKKNMDFEQKTQLKRKKKQR